MRHTTRENKVVASRTVKRLLRACSKDNGLRGASRVVCVSVVACRTVEQTTQCDCSRVSNLRCKLLRTQESAPTCSLAAVPPPAACAAATAHGVGRWLAAAGCLQLLKKAHYQHCGPRPTARAHRLRLTPIALAAGWHFAAAIHSFHRSQQTRALQMA